MTKKFKYSDKGVNEKMVTEYEAFKLLSGAEKEKLDLMRDKETREKAKKGKADREKKEKFEMRKKNHLKKTEDFKSSIFSINNCKDMSEQEI